MPFAFLFCSVQVPFSLHNLRPVFNLILIQKVFLQDIFEKMKFSGLQS